jgi:hypothetical protein
LARLRSFRVCRRAPLKDNLTNKLDEMEEQSLDYKEVGGPETAGIGALFSKLV